MSALMKRYYFFLSLFFFFLPVPVTARSLKGAGLLDICRLLILVSHALRVLVQREYKGVFMWWMVDAYLLCEVLVF